MIYELVDGPGIYSLDQFSQLGKDVLNIIEDSDIIVNIVDATNLERNLNLTLQLLQIGKPMLVCLNFWDDTVHNGIIIDISMLENILGIPVVAVSALHNEGIEKLVASLQKASIGSMKYDAENHWNQIGDIISKIQMLKHRHHTSFERFSDFTLHPVGGIVTAVAVLLATLIIVRFMGEGLINGLLDPFYTNIYAPFIMDLTSHISSEFIKGLLVGYSTDPLESFGIFTSGVYIALILVFPYFLSFYLVFGFIDWDCTGIHPFP
jgi:ferrous iron transport protein B